MRLDPSLELVKNGRIDSSLLSARKAASASVSWMYFFHRSSALSPVRLVLSGMLLRASPAKCGGLARPPIRIEAPRRSVLLHLVQIGDLGITGLNPSYLSLDLVAIFQSLFGDSLVEFLRDALIRVENQLRIAFSFAFEPPSAKAHRFLSSGYARQFHINLWATCSQPPSSNSRLKFLELLRAVPTNTVRLVSVKPPDLFTDDPSVKAHTRRAFPYLRSTRPAIASNVVTSARFPSKVS